MKKLNITYDTFEIENGERVEGETCYTVEIGDDKVAANLLDHGTSGVVVTSLKRCSRRVKSCWVVTTCRAA